MRPTQAVLGFQPEMPFSVCEGSEFCAAEAVRPRRYVGEFRH